jgi:hypothetical protein
MNRQRFDTFAPCSHDGFNHRELCALLVTFQVAHMQYTTTVSSNNIPTIPVREFS